MALYCSLIILASPFSKPIAPFLSLSKFYLLFEICCKVLSSNKPFYVSQSEGITSTLSNAVELSVYFSRLTVSSTNTIVNYVHLDFPTILWVSREVPTKSNQYHIHHGEWCLKYVSSIMTQLRTLPSGNGKSLNVLEYMCTVIKIMF
jgi:hypothetical protein